MPWIDQVPVSDATGPVKEEFDKAVGRAGRVWHIVHIMSLNPLVMRTSMDHYVAVMHGPSPLSRVRREMLAAALDCFY